MEEIKNIDYEKAKANDELEDAEIEMQDYDNDNPEGFE